MRTTLLAFLSLASVACSDNGPNGNNNITGLGTGPALTIVVGTRQVADANGTPVLEAFASMKNETAVHLRLGQCPLFVQLYWDPMGQHPGGVSTAMACPSGSPTLDMAPGDSTMQARVLPADSLTAYPAGTYSVNVVVTSGNGVGGYPAGDVTLPLTAP